MTTCITQEQAWEIAKPLFSPTLCQTMGSLYFAKFANAAIQAYRDSLVAGVVLPEPVGYWSGGDFDMSEDEAISEHLMSPKTKEAHDKCGSHTQQHAYPLAIFTADQLRQAIADALAKNAKS